MKAGCQRDACIPVFSAALFTTTEVRKAPPCPSVRAWMKVFYICVCVSTYVRTPIVVPLKCTHCYV